MSRITIFLYGLLTYVLTLAIFVYGFGFIGGFLTPTMLDGPPTRPLGEALIVDLGLLALFAVQHSGMARPAFKRWWTRIIPAAAERSTYVLVSSVLMIAFFVYWEPIGGTLWTVTGEGARTTVIGLYTFGWLLLVFTTFLIDHFDLFGLAQVWRLLTGKSYQPPRFRTPSLYRLVRHPLYVGWLLIFWSAPTMTVAHFVFAVMTTVYIVVAIQFEERDLEDAFGADYAAYRRRTPMLIPGLRSSRPASAQETGVDPARN
jgi:protein-S-isoprenylcysteine O-methyltransferase Ste14